MNLKGKVCLVTGAAHGIGRSLVTGFTRRGALVVATDVTAPQTEAALNLAYDVADSARAPDVMDEVVRRFGRLDAFVANAGIMPRQDWTDISTEDWERVIRVNLDGAWFGAKAAAGVMTPRGRGKIVFVSSIEVRLGVAVHCHYDAGKAGLIGLTRALARAVGPSGIRVNCLMPGAVQTESEKNMFPDQDQVAKDLAVRQCLPQRIQPEDIEPVAAFLCAEASDAITGQVLCADHGLIHY